MSDPTAFERLAELLVAEHKPKRTPAGGVPLYCRTGEDWSAQFGCRTLQIIADVLGVKVDLR